MIDQKDSEKLTKLLVVILNYRTPKLTIDCLHYLVDEISTFPQSRVVIGDNDSGDGSAEMIAEAIKTQGWSEWASFVPLERNGGYAFGNNALIHLALHSSDPPAYFLLLNPDTIIRPGALKFLFYFMETNREAGIAGSRLEDPDGTPQQSAFRFHSIASEIDYSLRLGVVSKLLAPWCASPPISQETCQTDWVAGASMIVRREVFETIGLLDEGYFMYYEEMDFCLQAKKSGWSCWYVPQSRVVHLVGQSSGVTDTKIIPKRRPQYWFDSRRRYFLKNYGWLYAAIADISWFSGFVVFQLRRLIQRKPYTDPPQLLGDFVQGSVFFKGAD